MLYKPTILRQPKDFISSAYLRQCWVKYTYKKNISPRFLIKIQITRYVFDIFFLFKQVNQGSLEVVSFYDMNLEESYRISEPIRRGRCPACPAGRNGGMSGGRAPWPWTWPALWSRGSVGAAGGAPGSGPTGEALLPGCTRPEGRSPCTGRRAWPAHLFREAGRSPAKRKIIEEIVKKNGTGPS